MFNVLISNKLTHDCPVTSKLSRFGERKPIVFIYLIHNNPFVTDFASQLIESYVNIVAVRAKRGNGSFVNDLFAERLFDGIIFSAACWIGFYCTWLHDFQMVSQHLNSEKKRISC